MEQVRFHITFGGRRTTVTVDIILSSMMAIRLGHIPESGEGRRAVRKWLQDTLVARLGDDAVRKNASQYARQYLIEAVADKIIADKWDEWVIENW